MTGREKKEVSSSNKGYNRHIYKLLVEAGCMLLEAGLAYLITMFKGDGMIAAVRNSVIAIACVGITGFRYRAAYLSWDLTYTNGYHFFRFWLSYALGILISNLCVFLPSQAWPFMALFVLFTLFSDVATGIVSGCGLLLMSIYMSGVGVDYFGIYFFSGIFCCVLFAHLEKGVRLFFPLFMSNCCFLLCCTANVVLVNNARPGVDDFVLPISNIIITALFIVLILKFFSGSVLYEFREKYLDLNDTENPMLVELREKDRNKYMEVIHTTYFCDRIGIKLQLDPDVMKCLSYYHSIVTSEEFLREHGFPPEVTKLIIEYMKNNRYLVSKEVCVVVAAERVIQAIRFMQEKNKGTQINYDQVVDTVFAHFHDNQTFSRSKLTMADYTLMVAVFKEEKMYYDFMH